MGTEKKNKSKKKKEKKYRGNTRSWYLLERFEWKKVTSKQKSNQEVHGGSGGGHGTP